MNIPKQADTNRSGEITIPGDRFFPEGVTVTSKGTFYVGSLYEGCIMRCLPGNSQMETFIEPGANGLISVLGLWADEARNLLWACSSDFGNGKLAGKGQIGVKAFNLQNGSPVGSYEFPGGGFANDITFDTHGNLYVTDSWSPRILRLSADSAVLEEWINDPRLGVDQWSLNGIDFDRSTNVIYTVNQKAGQLFRIPIREDGCAGEVVQISTTQEIRRPDGLKFIGPGLLATAEGGAGGMAVITVDGDAAEVRRISANLDGVTTFAYYQGSAWLVEGQSDHFWDPEHAGPDADPPFRIVEIPLG